jgi:hypothetical protein
MVGEFFAALASSLQSAAALVSPSTDQSGVRDGIFFS